MGRRAGNLRYCDRTGETDRFEFLLSDSDSLVFQSASDLARSGLNLFDVALLDLQHKAVQLEEEPHRELNLLNRLLLDFYLDVILRMVLTLAGIRVHPKGRGATSANF